MSKHDETEINIELNQYLEISRTDVILIDIERGPDIKVQNEQFRAMLSNIKCVHGLFGMTTMLTGYGDLSLNGQIYDFEVKDAGPTRIRRELEDIGVHIAIKSFDGSSGVLLKIFYAENVVIPSHPSINSFASIGRGVFFKFVPYNDYYIGEDIYDMDEWKFLDS